MKFEISMDVQGPYRSLGPFTVPVENIGLLTRHLKKTDRPCASEDCRMFATSGAVLIVSAVAFWLAIDRARLRFWREGVTALSAGLALATLGGGLLWYSVAHPGSEWRSNQGFGLDWSCLNQGRKAAQLCSRDAGPTTPAAPVPFGHRLMFPWLASAMGGVLGLGFIVGVFWFCFRRPPSIRTDGQRNRDTDYLLRNSRNDGHGGFL